MPDAGGIAAELGSGDARVPAPAANAIPDEWMHIAAYLDVPDLCHLACIAMRFRSVLTVCLSSAAAQVWDKVCFYGCLSRVT